MLLNNLEALYQDANFRKRLVFLAFRFSKDQEIAQDLVQDAFVKVWVKRHTLKEQKAMKSFIHRTVFNTASDWKRAQEVRQNHQQYLADTLKVEDICTLHPAYDLEQIFECIEKLNLFNDLEKKVFELWKKGFKNREMVDTTEEISSALLVVRTKEKIMHKLKRYKRLFHL